ncbi:NAD(P) transhydrogenase beta subunit [Leptospira inadai serovar Lyme str. 10]|uniref:NAD(P) transhydrogenase subunit beta n=2 Tax=Leptospira inadai serovar Lyme TaxID=293084 RepID=V6HH20_9LEPT|nr:NAD(P)(+) transhydrogenase (Re/Si-specific) subunit beta [Leptospira inadai]EQA35285.1 NAD(P) transhydrogenase beta subunit [Leptospira inadai serovar Lyme str. 10]PNV75909.1 NAD synthetase [Leptospira inadai serovar Lyme]
MEKAFINLLYLISSILFIIGLKYLSHPKTAVRGNFIGAIGMFLAVVGVFIEYGKIGQEDIIWIASGILVGTVIGTYIALKVEMTGMPQLVALLNGFGGLASFLVGGNSLMEILETGKNAELLTNYQFTISTAATGIIGAVTFTGSVIAFGKLQGLVSEKSVRYLGDQIVKILFFAGSLYLGYLNVTQPRAIEWYWYVVIVGSVLGVLLVMPIGGADMPVVIALLNSYSGIAASATGFVLGNNVLIIAGSLVGASGVILTQIMCKAMNRSLPNVLFGGLGGAVATTDSGDIYAGKTKSTSAEEVAMLLDMAQRVVIVPGYGMAVAQAQHAVRDLYNQLTDRGIEVEFAIHPVAGRMPGHMNVLLAEADIPYDKMKEMDEINPTFDTVDVVIINGANDVVNPLAKTDPNSPIAGMPILDVEKAKTIIVIKRSLSPGFAGVPNPLFIQENALMYFQDGKKATQEIVTALKDM